MRGIFASCHLNRSAQNHSRPPERPLNANIQANAASLSSIAMGGRDANELQRPSEFGRPSLRIFGEATPAGYHPLFVFNEADKIAGGVCLD
jgi:hypothetical protein